ncbi:hypothetical protein VCHA57P526_50322 [Vibrio chagasii]|nr:hypothetical protein VCHA40O231_40321 [Vibrio chagasii]CAH7455527.1 hypothetical protein VCHA57P526_50322 [Vibrio chagasii]
MLLSWRLGLIIRAWHIEGEGYGTLTKYTVPYKVVIFHLSSRILLQ